VRAGQTRSNSRLTSKGDAGAIQPERLLFLGFLVPDSDLNTIFRNESHPQYSALKFQGNLLKALEAAGARITAVTTPPIAAFPRNRNWWVRGASYQLAGLTLDGRQISTLNLPGVRLVMRLAQFVRHGAATPRGAGSDGILVYSLHTPLVAAALLLKRLRRAPVFVFIPDLPTLMGGPSHVLKRLLKRIDARLVRRLLAYADGAFPITADMAPVCLPGGVKHWTIEGISDEAARALSSARVNRSYVSRGVHRPILLYTGALEHVLPFARAFHRSSIDAALVFAGGGIEAPQLQALAAADHRIEVKPFMTGEAFAREIDRAHFMLNARDPSWEGAAYSFPSKVLEYLVTGKPIVSTRLPGIPDEYFGVLRPVDLVDQRSFDASLERALAADEHPEVIWRAAEQLANRLASTSVGPTVLRLIREWADLPHQS